MVGLGACNGPSSYTDFRAQLTQKWCSYQIRCGVLGASEVASCPAPTTILATLTPSRLDVPAALHEGRMRYVSSGAQRCLDALAGAPCDQAALEAAVRRDCHDVVQPNLAPGKQCLGAGECVGGYCEQATAFDGCPGTCKPYLSPGQPCVVDGAPAERCDPTVQYCGDPDDLDGGAPENRVCLRHKQPGDPCTSDEQCAFGYVCLGTCRVQPKLHDGDACSAPGTLCDDEVYCGQDGRCARRKPAGQSCLATIECRDKLACVGLATDAMNQRVAGACAPWLDVGATCSASGLSGCPSSQLCDVVTDPNGSTCQLAAPYGSPPGFHQPCTKDTPCPAFNSDCDCAAGLYCDGALCQYRLGVAGDCSRDATACQSGLPCLSDACSTGITCE